MTTLKAKEESAAGVAGLLPMAMTIAGIVGLLVAPFLVVAAIS